MTYLDFCRKNGMRVVFGMLFLLTVSAFATAQAVSPKQLSQLAQMTASKGITDIVAIRYLPHETAPGFDVAIVGQGGNHGWRILVFESRGDEKTLQLRWDSGYLPGYFGPASAEDVSVEQIADKEEVLVFQACAAHACPVAAFGIAIYSPWTGKGYFAYSGATGLKYEPAEKGRYNDLLAKLVEERKKRYELK